MAGCPADPDIASGPTGMKSSPQGLVAIHLAVLLFGLAGLLGKAVAAPPQVIVFARSLLAGLALGTLWLLAGPVQPLSWRAALFLLGSAGLLAIHWLTFFQAIQVSTVAIGLLSFASFPLFVTFLEPWFFRERPRRGDLLAAGAVVAGLALVVPRYDLGDRLTQGAAWGVLSSLTFALLSVLARKFVRTISPLLIGACQNAVAAADLCPFLRGSDWPRTWHDLGLLLALGLLCTALAHWLFLRGLVRVRAQVASIIASLEPVYGIFFAWLLLREMPTPRTLLGGAIILGVTALASARRQPGAQAQPPLSP
jgi:drug/metabolite transporter (DMT)-like permease